MVFQSVHKEYVKVVTHQGRSRNQNNTNSQFKLNGQSRKSYTDLAVQSVGRPWKFNQRSCWNVESLPHNICLSVHKVSLLVLKFIKLSLKILQQTSRCLKNPGAQYLIRVNPLIVSLFVLVTIENLLSAVAIVFSAVLLGDQRNHVL